MTTQPEADWEAIRAAYTRRDEAVTAIAKRFGVTASSIWSKARREDWEKPVAAKPGARGTTRKPPNVQPHQRAAKRKQVKQQLLEVLAMQVDRLERRLDCDSGMTSSDYEREARALNSLVRNFEALDVSQDKSTKSAKGSVKHNAQQTSKADFGEGKADDKDTLRRELAERLTRLQSQLAGRG